MIKISEQSPKKNVKEVIGMRSGFTVFDEKPSDSRMKRKEEMDEKRISAHDLFSMFTADIIKEETVFVR